MPARRSGTTRTPDSSTTSRTAASAGCSPGSMIPVTGVHAPLSARRTSSSWSPLRTTAVTPDSHSGAVPILVRSATTKSGIAIGSADRGPAGARFAERLVQLREQRAGLGQRTAGWQRHRRPARLLLGVVAGEDRVRGTALLVDLHEVGLSGPDAGATEGLVNLLRGMREERREHRVRVGDHLKRGVEHGVPAGGVLLELPRLLLGQVLVREAHHPHRLAERGLE